MGISRIDGQRVTELSVENLGLDSDVADFDSPEVLAGAVRRAASFICPASPRRLCQRLEESLRYLISADSDETTLTTRIRNSLEDLVNYGDLIEVPVFDEERGVSYRTLFLGQPSYVWVPPSRYLLIGVRAEGLSLLDEELMRRVDYRLHVRSIDIELLGDLRTVFEAAGLRERTVEEWLNHPSFCSPHQLSEEYEGRLQIASPSGAINGVRILDPAKSLGYFPGRWRAPSQRDTGNFVIRHPVEFGADAWAYASILLGEVEKLVRLPVRQQLDRACDEAWRLQAALDAMAGTPQFAKIRKSNSGESELHLFSPVPSWVQRRLDTVGRALPHRPGSLMSYSIADLQIDEELLFLAQAMWIEDQSMSSAS